VSERERERETRETREKEAPAGARPTGRNSMAISVKLWFLVETELAMSLLMSLCQSQLNGLCRSPYMFFDVPQWVNISRIIYNKKPPKLIDFSSIESLKVITSLRNYFFQGGDCPL